MTQSHGFLDEHARRLRVLETQGTDILTPSLSPLYMPQLRGFWPLSSVDENGNAYDLSGQARTLTNNSALAYGVDVLALYAVFDGVADYLSRADEAGLSASGSLTVFGWFYNDAIGSQEAYMGKWTTAGDQREYRLRKRADDLVVFEISTAGTAITIVSVGSSPTTLEATTWYFLAGRFDSGSSVDVFINDEYTSTATAATATFSGTSPFEIGSTDGGAFFSTGRGALFGLCAAALSDTQLAAIYNNSRALFGV